MDVVKLAEAVAWPLASIIIALVFLLVTRMIVTKSGKMGVKIKDWFSMEADTSKQIVETVTNQAAAERIEAPDAATAGGDVLVVNDGSTASLPSDVADAPEEQADRPFSRVIAATTLTDLESAFADFKSEDDVKKEIDFWTSFFVERKKGLGIPGTSDELEALANANPTWIYPSLDLLRAAVEAHDTDRALQLIEQLLARRTSENATYILPTVLYAYFALYSPERAMQFYQEQNKYGLTSSEKTSLLSALAGNLDKGADKFAYRTASEMALVADPGKKAEAFQLAYSYGDDDKSWALSYNAYAETGHKSDQYVWSLNNRGVLLQGIDKSASVDFYERGLDRGNAQAISNLARLLIEDGYIAVGERLLDGIADPGDAAEHVATTRAAALKARRKTQKQLEEVATFAAAEAQRYRAVIGRALRALDAGVTLTNGLFASEDGAFLVMLDAAGAAVRSTVGTISLEGVLPMSSVGSNGIIYTKGSGLLGSILYVSIFATGRSEMTAVIWPATKSQNERMRFIELSHKTNHEAVNGNKLPAALIGNS
jgi:hypothetical protein